MRETADIIFNVTGQTLAVRYVGARPSSATYSVFADSAGDDDDAEFSGSCTLDSPNTAVDAASGISQANPKKLSVTSTTGLVKGRKYRVTEAAARGGHYEWVEPVQIFTDDYIICRHPLRNDYTTSATLQSTYLLITIDATWVADSDNLSDVANPWPDYRARIVVTPSSGANDVIHAYFDLVRTPAGHSVTIDDLTARWPGLLDQIDHDDLIDRGARAIDAAWRRVRAQLAALSLNEDALSEHEFSIDEYVIVEARLVLAEGGVHPLAFSAMEFLELAQASADRYYERHFAVVGKHPIAKGTDGGAAGTQRQPAWVK